MLVRGSKDMFQVVFRQHKQIGGLQTQPDGPQADLLDGFFTAHVQGFYTVPIRQRRQHLQQQRGFTYAGIAAQQDHGTADQSAAQGTVEFIRPG